MKRNNMNTIKEINTLNEMEDMAQLLDLADTNLEFVEQALEGLK